MAGTSAGSNSGGVPDLGSFGVECCGCWAGGMAEGWGTWEWRSTVGGGLAECFEVGAVGIRGGGNGFRDGLFPGGCL